MCLFFLCVQEKCSAKINNKNMRAHAKYNFILFNFLCNIRNNCMEKKDIFPLIDIIFIKCDIHFTC